MKKFFDELNEATVTNGYPDSGDNTGISSDDDLAPGTTVFGDKMVPVEVENRLTGKTIKYVPAADLGQEWNYDEFEYSQPMGSIKAYSKTLDDLDGMLGGRLFNRTDRRKYRMSKDKWELRKSDQDGSGTKQTAKMSDDREEVLPMPKPDSNDYYKDAIKEETMDITEKINQFLGEPEEQINEAVADKDDRKALTQAILKGKSVAMKLDSLGGVELKVAGKGDKVVVEYSKNEDLTLTLVDICDTLGYDFEIKKQGSKQNFYIEK